MGSNLSDRQAELLCDEFDCATFILDREEAGQKLKVQVLLCLVPRMSVRIIETEKQLDLMLKAELAALHS